MKHGDGVTEYSYEAIADLLRKANATNRHLMNCNTNEHFEAMLDEVIADNSAVVDLAIEFQRKRNAK